VTYSERISAPSDELHEHFVRSRIDLRQRDIDRRDPNKTLSDGDIAARPRDANLDRRGQPVRRWIDMRDRTVALIERPYGRIGAGEKARRRPYRDTRDYVIFLGSMRMT
jgi:hypothetical protein